MSDKDKLMYFVNNELNNVPVSEKDRTEMRNIISNTMNNNITIENDSIVADNDNIAVENNNIDISQVKQESNRVTVDSEIGGSNVKLELNGEEAEGIKNTIMNRIMNENKPVNVEKSEFDSITNQLFGDNIKNEEARKYILGDSYEKGKDIDIYGNQTYANKYGEFVAYNKDKLKIEQGSKDYEELIDNLVGNETKASRESFNTGFDNATKIVKEKEDVEKAFIDTNNRMEGQWNSYIEKIEGKGNNVKYKNVRDKVLNGEALSTPEEQQIFQELKDEYSNIQKEYDKIVDTTGVSKERIFKYETDNKAKGAYTFRNQKYDDYKTRVKKMGADFSDKEIGQNGFVVKTNVVDKNIQKEAYDISRMTSDNMASALGQWNDTKDDYKKILDNNADNISEDIKKLLNLDKNNIDIGADGKEVLKRKAAAIQYGVSEADKTKSGVNTLIGIDKNASILADKYNISNDNIQYLNNSTPTNDNPISLTMDSNGKVGFSQSTINKMTDAERDKYKDFKGTEDLTELSENISNRGYMKDSITRNNFKGKEEEFLEDINKKWKNTKDATSSYGMTKAEQFKKMGASDEMISKLEKGERLTGKDLKGFTYEKFDESYIELANMDEDVIDNMLYEYQKDLSDINSINPKDKRTKAKAIYDDIISKKASSLNDISDDFEFNLDVSDEKAVRKFLENINANKTTGDQINVAKMMSEYVTKSKSKNTKLSVGSIVDAYSNNGTTGVSNLIKDTNDKNAKDMFNKAFDKVIGILEKSGNEDLKNLGGHFKKMSRDDSFTKDVIEKTAFKETVDKAPEFKTLQDGKGMEIAKKAMGNKYVKIGAGIAAVAGVGAMAIGAMNNAAEERERKRQEMNMLIASQNSSIRGGY